MRIIRIYQDSELPIGTEIELSKNAQQHLIQVLRLKVGATIHLFNGRGDEVIASLQTISKKSATATIQQSLDINNESPLHIHLYQAVSRSEKMDFVIQKATELGVASITPVITERSQIKLTAERWQKRLNHWRAVIISACEQCGRNQLPDLSEPVVFNKLLTQTQNYPMLMLHPKAAIDFKQLSQDYNELGIVIGAEGGFSEHEILAATDKGYRSLRMGPRVLRTETAAIAAIAVLQNQLGDLA